MRLSAKIQPFIAAFILGFLALRASATTYYADINSPNPTPPYTNWNIASTDIQSAVNLTTNGDLVLVNPGVYQSGGYMAPDTALTCVVGLNPTNPASVLAMLPSVPTNNTSGIKVTWQSISGILYSVHRSTNLSAPFSTLQSNLPGQAGTTSYTDTTATNNTPYFYRVSVP